LKNNRFNLLSDTEIQEIYARPIFNEDQRQCFFSLKESDYLVLNNYRRRKAKLYFILQLGYFRANQQFHDFRLEEVKKDTLYINSTYFSNEITALSGKIARDTYQKQRADILNLEGYRQWNNQLSPKVKSRLIQLLRYFPKGDDTLRELLVYLNKQKITLPSYRTLQDLFTTCFSIERKRLGSIMGYLPDEISLQLDEIIKNEDGISKLSLIRSDQKDFQYTAVKLEIEKVILLKELYYFSKAFIPKLNLANNAVRYYAALAERYPISRLRKLKKTQQWLYMICFIYHRYQQLMDNLVTSFIVNINEIIKESKAYADTKFMLHSSEIVVNFPNLSTFLRWFVSDKHPESISLDEFSRQAYSILPKDKFFQLAEYMEGSSFDKEKAQWEYLSSISRLLSLYFRPILLAVDFKFYQESGKMTELIDLLKTHYQRSKNPSELKLSDDLGLTLNRRDIPYLKMNATDQYVDPYRFEFYVYKKMCHQLSRGRLFCNESVAYRDLEQDLVGDEIVDQAELIAQKFGYEKIPIYCDLRLDHAIQDLLTVWKETNENIQSGQNKAVNLETKHNIQTWSLSYESTYANESDSFFNNLGSVEIADICRFIGDKVKLWSAFSHIKYKSRKHRQANQVHLIACLLSLAFGFGIHKMAGISDINYHHLETAFENFIRPDTLKLANKILSDFTSALPIFKIWNIMDDSTIADADGQKVETSKHTIQSRYSSKYFGTAKGVAVYTLMLNHVPVNAKVIGPNEHESYHLYDLIYNNDTNIPINAVTGDNHSINQLNFIALDAIDVSFIPSIKNIKEASEKLYSVDHHKNYTGVLRPVDKINVSLIRSQKRGILRILLSLILQENTQAVIVKKLVSHTRYTRLRAALWEYNKIFRSTHILNLINDMSLRQSIRKARNRTEAYHQLQNAIRKVYRGIFSGQRTSDNLIRAESSRLIANIIVAYNAILLN
jgi:TnpA family transposase